MRFLLSSKQTAALEEAGSGGRRCCLSSGGRCHQLEDGQPCFRLDGDARILLSLRLREFRQRLRSSSGHLSRRVPARSHSRRPGIKAARHVDELIEDLYEVYHLEGGAGEITYDPYTDECSGPFLAFTKTALSFFDVRLTDHALRKRIGTVIKGRLLWD